MTDEPVFDRLEDTDDHVFKTNAIVQVHRPNLRYQLVEATDGSRYWRLLGPGEFGPMTTVGRPTQRVEFRKRIDLRPPVHAGTAESFRRFGRVFSKPIYRPSDGADAQPAKHLAIIDDPLMIRHNREMRKRTAAAFERIGRAFVNASGERARSWPEPPPRRLPCQPPIR